VFVGIVLIVAGCGGGGSGPQDKGTQADVTESTSDTQRQGTNDAEETESDSGSSQSITGDGNSVSQSNKVSGGTSSSSSQTSSGGNGLASFSGQGQSNLTFNVEQPSRLSWTNDEDETFAARGGGINIDSRRGRGELELDPGRYKDVQVHGATWTIIVRPR